jgi:hypothetical protein
VTAPARHPCEGEERLLQPRQAASTLSAADPAALIADDHAILDAAASAALMRVGEAFCSLMTFSRAR